MREGVSCCAHGIGVVQRYTIPAPAPTYKDTVFDVDLTMRTMVVALGYMNTLYLLLRLWLPYHGDSFRRRRRPDIFVLRRGVLRRGARLLEFRICDRHYAGGRAFGVQGGLRLLYASDVLLTLFCRGHMPNGRQQHAVLLKNSNAGCHAPRWKLRTMQLVFRFPFGSAVVTWLSRRTNPTQKGLTSG